MINSMNTRRTSECVHVYTGDAVRVSVEPRALGSIVQYVLKRARHFDDFFASGSERNPGRAG
jgi:hypothetical protein